MFAMKNEEGEYYLGRRNRTYLIAGYAALSPDRAYRYEGK
jgi:hypothetical protein